MLNNKLKIKVPGNKKEPQMRICSSFKKVFPRYSLLPKNIMI